MPQLTDGCGRGVALVREHGAERVVAPQAHRQILRRRGLRAGERVGREGARGGGVSGWSR